MEFDLKKPCKDCPFVEARDFMLHPERIREIADADFPCHKTVDYDDDDDGGHVGSDAQACFGHLVIQWKEYGAFNPGTALAAQLGMFDPHALPEPAEVGCFESFGDYAAREEDRAEGRLPPPTDNSTGAGR